MKFIPERDESSGPKLSFLKLAPNEKVKGVFRGDIFDFMQHWPKGGQKTRCTGRETCAACKRGEKPDFRFQVNFVMKDDKGNLVAKAFEQGWLTYKQMRAINKELEEHGLNLQKAIVSISKEGSDKASRHYVNILPGPAGTVSPEFEKKLATVQLQPIGPEDQSSQSEPAREAETVVETEDDLPF